MTSRRGNREGYCDKHLAEWLRPVSREDTERVSRLHRVSAGLYRVGASPLTIRRYDGRYEGDKRTSWDIYGDTLEGPCRIPGRWAFPKLAQARVRAFTYAREQGWV